MPDSAPTNVYTVTQTDHMASIASDQQLESFARIWNDPDNADLRKRRETPHGLLPGDVVTVAPRDPRIFEKPTGKQHVFTVNLMPLKLRLAVLDHSGKPGRVRAEPNGRIPSRRRCCRRAGKRGGAVRSAPSRRRRPRARLRRLGARGGH